MDEAFEQDVARRLNSLSERFSLHKAKPYTDHVDLFFTMDPMESLDSLSLSDIAKYIVLLSQYALSLNYEQNRLLLRRNLFHRKLERQVLRISGSFSGTKEERRRLAIDSIEELSYLEDEIDKLDAEITLLSSFPEVVKELINALKKHRDTKELEYRISGFRPDDGEAGRS